jgi:hypothetical protein
MVGLISPDVLGFHHKQLDEAIGQTLEPAQAGFQKSNSKLVQVTLRETLEIMLRQEATYRIDKCWSTAGADLDPIYTTASASRPPQPH